MMLVDFHRKRVENTLIKEVNQPVDWLEEQKSNIHNQNHIDLFVMGKVIIHSTHVTSHNSDLHANIYDAPLTKWPSICLNLRLLQGR